MSTLNGKPSPEIEQLEKERRVGVIIDMFPEFTRERAATLDGAIIERLNRVVETINAEPPLEKDHFPLLMLMYIKSNADYALQQIAAELSK